MVTHHAVNIIRQMLRGTYYKAYFIRQKYYGVYYVASMVWCIVYCVAYTVLFGSVSTMRHQVHIMSSYLLCAQLDKCKIGALGTHGYTDDGATRSRG